MIRPDLEHFLQQAVHCVPHLSDEKRLEWAQHCERTHPGFKDDIVTQALYRETAAEAAEAEAAGPIPVAHQAEPNTTAKDEFSITELLKAVLFLLFLIFFLLCLLVSNAHAAEKAPPSPTTEERSQIQALQLQAHQIVARISRAEITRLKAEAAAAAAEVELDAKNAQINAFVARLREKYSAAGMDLSPDFAWKLPEKK